MNLSELPKRYVSDGPSNFGGFSSVITCKDLHLERPVAIKSIQDKQELPRIIDEVNALLSLRSNHVVQVYDRIQFSDGDIAIVEEYIEGPDLFQYIDSIKSDEQYVKTLWQISAGIADIHDAGIIHRDIKPNNMKVDPEGIVKIFDFGLSRYSDENAETLGFKGTWPCAAPEICTSQHVKFTAAIDVYAFGVSALLLASASLPDELTCMPKVPCKNNPFEKIKFNLPQGVAQILFATLAFDPHRRPSIYEVRDSLASLLLRGRHKAILVHNGKTLFLNSKNRQVTLRKADIGEIVVNYNGYHFSVERCEGEVLINNAQVYENMRIPGSCVIVIGQQSRGSSRAYITFDISRPEVVL